MMVGQADGRTIGRLRQGWILVVGGLLLSVGPTVRRSHAQVGHEPAQSPYRDIVRGPGPVVFAGHLAGERGRAGVGPSDAFTVGLRYEMPLGRPIVLQLGASYLKGDRFIVNPAADSTSPDRRTGPFDSALLLTEVGLQLRLTGAKSWRGLAPYLGVGMGMAFDLDSPGDTTRSGYRFGSRLTLAGGGGARWHPARRLTVHVDARAVLWRLRYPVSFHTAAGDGSRVVPLEEPLTDWTVHPWVGLGIGWTF